MKLRYLIILSSTMLSACSSDFSSAPPEYVSPGPPSQSAIESTARSVAKTAKIVDPLEISAAIQSDHGGPGNYYVCVREANAPSDGRQRYYAIFFDNDAVKGFRQPAFMDKCEQQTFSPLPPGPATSIEQDTKK